MRTRRGDWTIVAVSEDRAQDEAGRNEGGDTHPRPSKLAGRESSLVISYVFAGEWGGLYTQTARDAGSNGASRREERLAASRRLKRSSLSLERPRPLRHAIVRLSPVIGGRSAHRRHGRERWPTWPRPPRPGGPGCHLTRCQRTLDRRARSISRLQISDQAPYTRSVGLAAPTRSNAHVGPLAARALLRDRQRRRGPTPRLTSRRSPRRSRVGDALAQPFGVGRGAAHAATLDQLRLTGSVATSPDRGRVYVCRRGGGPDDVLRIHRVVVTHP